MNAINRRKTQGKKPAAPVLAEVRHLREKAHYYQRLGCVDIARSLKDLADAKETKAQARRRIGN